MEDKSINEKKIDDIIKKCKNAMDVSYYKYGEARKNFAEGRVDALKSLDNCLIKFNKTKILNICKMPLIIYYLECYFQCQKITIRRRIRLILRGYMEHL